jgi:hypothetical protein
MYSCRVIHTNLTKSGFFNSMRHSLHIVTTAFVAHDKLSSVSALVQAGCAMSTSLVA